VIDSPAVSTDRLVKVYGEGELAVRALAGIDLQIERGAFVVLLGPSGSGKTTLLNVIGGIDTATSGSVRVDGVDLSGLDRSARTRFRRDHIGFVFQSYQLVPTLTAEENVLLPLDLAGDGYAGAPRARELLGRVGLADRIKHYPVQLSGGEQQRVAIARALAVDPAILIADEPTGNLDGATGAEIADLLFDAVSERDTTLVLVTHDAELAARCDRTVRITAGHMEADPAPLRTAALGS